MNFNGLADIGDLGPTATRQVSPGKGASCVARIAEHGPAGTGRFRPAPTRGLDRHELEARGAGDLALATRF